MSEAPARVLVDGEGRVFGRLNLVDAVFGILALAVIPLLYGAYLMFRTPPPQLTAVEPSTVIQGPNLHVTVRGENFRPYMRVSFDDTQGHSFIFRNMSEAIVDLNPMPPGVYDVVLYDAGQERARLPKAFTVSAPPLPASDVALVGTFGNLTAERAAGLTPGMEIANLGTIAGVGEAMPEATRVFAGPVLEMPIDKAVRVPVVLHVACGVRAPQGVPQCTIGDAALRQTSMVVLTTPLGQLPFQVDQIRGLQPVEPVRVTVQFVARREILAAIRAGDTDHGEFRNPLAAGAVVTAVGSATRVAEDTDRVDLTLTADAQRGSSSWTYASASLRAGAQFLLRTPRYELQGTVIRIEPEWTPPAQDAVQGKPTR